MSGPNAFRVVLCAASLAASFKARKAGHQILLRLSKPVPMLKRAVGAVVVIVILRRLEKILGKALAPAPGALGGMIILSSALIAVDKLGGRQGKALAKAIVAGCQPAAEFLSRWMPLFFVPPLVSLPLALRSISVRDAPLALLVHVVLYFVTCASTAVVTSGLAKRPPRDATEENNHHSPAPLTTTSNPTMNANHGNNSHPPVTRTTTPTTATAESNAPLLVTGLSTAALSVLSLVLPNNQLATEALLTSLTVFTYVLGSSSARVKAVLHPVVVCGALTAVGTAILGSGRSASGASTVAAALQSYAARPGGLFMALLGTSLFALGFKMYNARDLIIQNIVPIAVGSSWAAVFSLYGTAIVARLTAVNSKLAGAFLARSLTTPLAVAVSKILGSDVSLTVGAVVLSGILGANFGKQFLAALGFKRNQSVARGVAMGASAHGLGTAALSVDEPEASSSAAVTFAITGTLSTILVSIAPLRQLLLRIASNKR